MRTSRRVPRRSRPGTGLRAAWAAATFLRTTVTRDTPWDRFLAGSNGALTENQRRGAKLSDDQVEDIADFIENGLYDPAFAKFDPKAPKTFFELSPIDFTYSKYRPDLAALGAVDGRPPSGRPQNNDDPLSRRDAGLEFLDVTANVHAELIGSNRSGGKQRDVYRITNNSTSIVDTHLLMIAQGLAGRLENASGVTKTGDPYRRVFLTDGVLLPGQSIVRTLLVKRQSHDQRPSYRLTFLSGQGNP